jgi:hypothetical protein
MTLAYRSGPALVLVLISALGGGVGAVVAEAPAAS